MVTSTVKNEAERLADQLKRAFDGDAWHGPSLREALAGVTVGQAVARPVAGAHTIWELVTHIAGWEGVVARRLTGEAVLEPAAGNFPAPSANATAVDWTALLGQAYAAHEPLVAQVAALTAADLERAVAGDPPWAWIMVHGAVAHVAYHVGQIVLLKRLLT